MTKKEMEVKIRELEKDLDAAHEVIKNQLKEIENIRLMHKNQINQEEYSSLSEEHRKLEEKHKELLNLYNKQEEKLEKFYRRNKAGRKSKMTEELTVNIHKLRKENMSIRKISEKLGVSIGLVHKILHL